jgi:type I restriction enzyme S subunit
MIESNFVQDISALKKLPKTWKVLDFTDVISDISGGNKKFLKSDFLEEGKIPVVDQGKDLIAGYVNEESAIVKGMPPYIVFGDHTRILKFIDFPFVMGADGTKVLKVKKLDLNSERYLFHYLKSLSIPETGYNRHYKYLKAIKIPLPPLQQQQKIANILDAADALRHKDKALLAKYDELTQALFLDMFGDPVSNPKGFSINRLEEFYLSKKEGTKCGPFGGALKKEEFVEKGIPVWNMDNITKKGELVSKMNLWITNEKFNILNSYAVINGDIIISRAGTVGKMCVVNTTFENSIISTNLIRLRLNNNLLLPMYFVLLMTYFKEKIGRLQTGSDGAFSHMNTGVLNDLKFPYPPIELQNQFAERVQAIEQQKSIAQRSLEKSEALFNSLLQKAFKGELV